ncbi:MAG TPA: ribosome maturation factor RimM [Mycobacteriales bacterium]|nr:ribosome maturation factor RimM [Mycobacteriales bacterium]
MELVVGRIGRPHGVRGDVAVRVRTDDPDSRFAVGSVLATDPTERGPLTVEAVRWHSGRLLVRFGGVGGRDAAQALGGTLLVVDSAELPPLDDPDEFYDHELVGLAALLPDGTPVGEVTDVAHGAGGDLLVVARPDGSESLVPFVAAVVPRVDVAAGRLVVDPPGGLLDL